MSFLLETLFAKLSQRDALSQDERDALTDATTERRSYAAREVIVPRGVPQVMSNLIVDGYVARSKELPDGQRQILQIHLPGDFIDLPSFLLKVLEHDLVAITPTRIARFPHERIVRITETRPHLTRLLWLGTLLESAMYREQILSIGRRTAKARLAHLFCELHVRHDIIGSLGADGFPLPFTQADLADATGMTAVHVNRMLRRLRAEKLIELAGRRLRILDWNGLCGVADFDPAYLYLDRRPR